MKHSTWWSAGLVLLMLAVPAAEAAAQRGGRGARPTVSIGLSTGLGLTGRFIEQDVLPDNNTLPPLGQRVLTTPANFNLGATVGTWIFNRINVEGSYTWVPTRFEYRDDSGTDSDRFDQDDIASLNMHILGIKVITLILPEAARLTPYIEVGFNGTAFVLGDEARTGLLASDGTHFRVGTTSGLGLRYRFSPTWSIRVGTAFNSLGNPFRGKEAFVPTTGLIYDKSDAVRLTQFQFVLIHTFWHRR